MTHRKTSNGPYTEVAVTAIGIRSVFTERKGDVMLKYVLKRLGYILVTLWVIVTCTFFMMKKSSWYTF